MLQNVFLTISDVKKVQKMVKSCVVPKCNSGLKSQTPSESKISYQKFPTKDLELRKKWITKVRRENNVKTNKP